MIHVKFYGDTTYIDDIGQSLEIPTTLKEEKDFLFRWQAKRYIKRSPYIFYSWKESK